MSDGCTEFCGDEDCDMAPTLPHRIDPKVCMDPQPDSQTGEPGGERCGWCPGCSVDRYLRAAREAGADAVTVDGGLVTLEWAGEQVGIGEVNRVVPLDGGDDGEA